LSYAPTMASKTKLKTAQTIDDPELALEDDDHGIETEADIGQIPLNILRDAVVFSTDWTTETLIGQLAKGNIDLDPAFQRRDAWNGRRKSLFIESLILGLPIPQIVLAEKKAGKGSFLIIDGKQRLLSLLKFTSGTLGQEPFALSNLKLRHDLNGSTYEDLKLRKDDLNSFENQTIRTVVIRHWQKEDLLYLIFHRLNSETLPLSPQELRQALHPGLFLKFCDEHSQSSAALKRILKIAKPDFRMRDVEILVRYFAFKNFADEYTGDLKKFLDESCEYLNENWEEWASTIVNQAKAFETAVELAYDVFDGYPFRKWGASDVETYENRFNRAIFDVIIYFFTEKKIVTSMTPAKKIRVNRAFKHLCLHDEAFIRAVESTTKSKTATATRFNRWGAALSKAIGVAVVVPKIT
jgi:hypothetical protein